MPPTIVFAVSAFAICVALIPLLRRAAARWRLYDHPGALKIHSAPIPRLGGIAMMAGLCACLLPATKWASGGFAFCIGAFCLVWIVGLVDDLKSLPPLVRLVVHLAAGAALGSTGWRLHWFNSIALDVFLTSVFVAFIINALNFFDGLDGLVAGTSGMAAIGFLWLFAESGDVLGQIIAGSLVGICFGMFVYNRPPATIFMGDSGSTLVGMLLAFLILNWIRVQPDVHGVASPVILISLPLCDAVVVILRRIGCGKSPFGGDRLHLYDLLLEHGWSAQDISVTSMSITAALIFVAILSQRQPHAAQIVALLLFIGVWRISHALSPANSTIKSARPAAHECPEPDSIAE